MNDRAKEIADDLLRYLKEAGEEWLTSLEDSPPSHFYTAITALVLAKILSWVL